MDQAEELYGRSTYVFGTTFGKCQKEMERNGRGGVSSGVRLVVLMKEGELLLRNEAVGMKGEVLIAMISWSHLESPN